MKNNIEEDIVKVNKYIELVLEKDYCNCNELNTILGKHCDGSKNVAYAMQHILSDYKRVLKEVKRYKNMYEAEHQIHLVRNEQLDRKQKAIIKCNELENENKELKEEIKSWKKYSDEQEEIIIEKNNIICNLEFQIEKLQKENAELKNEHSCLINRIENKIDKLDYEMERAKRRNDQERANYCWDFLINFKNLLESEE